VEESRGTRYWRENRPGHVPRLFSYIRRHGPAFTITKMARMQPTTHSPLVSHTYGQHRSPGVATIRGPSLPEGSQEDFAILSLCRRTFKNLLMLGHVETHYECQLCLEGLALVTPGGSLVIQRRLVVRLVAGCRCKMLRLPAARMREGAMVDAASSIQASISMWFLRLHGATAWGVRGGVLSCRCRMKAGSEAAPWDSL
jgi:hypothetical protein